MINQNCSLVLRDLYYYDIVSAFPTLMKQQNYDFKDVDINDKEQRNLFIGKQQIGNQNLSGFLNESVKDLTDFYLQYNEIDDKDVIFRQKDGFILTKMLTFDNSFVEMKLRHMISIMIIDIKREKYITFDEDNNLSVKGVRHYYHRLDEIYKMFLDLNFYDIDILCTQLQNIKNIVLNQKDISFYGIEDEDDVGMLFIYKNGKNILTRDIDFIEPNKIDRNKYFDFYFKPFIDSIFMEVFYARR